MKIRSFFLSGVVLLVFALIIFPIRGVSLPAYALDINVIDLTGGNQPTALAAFEQAAGYWESSFIDPITVNVEFNFTSLGSETLRSANNNKLGFSFSDVKTALSGDVKSAFDSSAVSNLPGGTSIQFRTNEASTGSIILDNNGSSNNTFLDVNISNARALGIYTASDSTLDGSIQLNSDFSFDFDQSDGITPDQWDFVGISTHQLGHTLGFISGVDFVDVSHGAGPSAFLDLNNFRVFSVWDLYRYSSDSLTLGGPGTLDFATGTHPGGNPYFSIDGGTTALATFETGMFNGTGRQASHWSESPGIGIMDPTFVTGELLQITSLDITAFDVMGYDVTVVPEPISSTLFIVGGATLGIRRYWKKRKSINI